MSNILKEYIEILAEEALSKGEHVADNGFSKEEAKIIAKQLGIDFSKKAFSFEDFVHGINVELEHTDVTKKSPTMTAKIALAHLAEDPRYYKALKKMEAGLEKSSLKENNAAAPVMRQLHIPLPPELMQLSAMFSKAGKQFYLVGGSVRDALLGKEPKDFDLATNAVPDEIIGILSQDPSIKILEIGKSFGVIVAVMPSGEEFEIATFRKDESAGRRPDAVSFTTIDQDVARRDLTINALFYDIQSQTIIDYVGGIADIENSVVKTVGRPSERFGEDRLRILRALRFAGRLGSGLDPETANAIKQDNSLEGVSGERVRDEFLKGVKSAKSVPYFLNLLTEYNMWDSIFPGLNVAKHSFPETKNFPVLVAVLLVNNEQKKIMSQLNKLKYTGDEVKQVGFLSLFKGLNVNNAFQIKRLFKNSHLNPQDLREYSKIVGAPDDQLVEAFIKYEPSISGSELQAQGFSGIELGKEQARRETELFSKMI